MISPAAELVPSWYGRAEAIISELDSLNQRSFAFRYPVGKDRATQLDAYCVVDVEHFQSVIAEPQMIFDGMGAWLDGSLDVARDMAT